jgi:hypothetical protein
MAHTPLKMSIAEAHAEVKDGWARSYSPQAIFDAVTALEYKPLAYRINILIARLCFRGIYFPSMGRFAWMRVVSQNRRVIMKLIKEGFAKWRGVAAKTAPHISPTTSAPSASAR